MRILICSLLVVVCTMVLGQDADSTKLGHLKVGISFISTSVEYYDAGYEESQGASFSPGPQIGAYFNLEDSHWFVEANASFFKGANNELNNIWFIAAPLHIGREFELKNARLLVSAFMEYSTFLGTDAVELRSSAPGELAFNPGGRVAVYGMVGVLGNMGLEIQASSIQLWAKWPGSNLSNYESDGQDVMVRLSIFKTFF